MWAWYGSPNTTPVAANTLEVLFQAGGRRALPVAGRYMLVRVRGAEPAALEIPLPVARSAIELEVLPAGGATAAPYRLVIERDGSEPKRVTELTGLAPGEDGLVAAWLDSERIQRGRYTVELSPERGETAAPAERFVIELR
jgi:hypothetical protein